MSGQTRVPDLPEENPELMRFLDSVDRRQKAAGQLADLAPAATLADVITAYNALLATQRTR